MTQVLSSGLVASPGAIQFAVRNDWGNGFVADMSLKNLGASLQGWTISFEANFEITNLWNAEIVSRVGNRYTLRNLSWNGSVPTQGTVSWGFVATTSVGAARTPTAYSVNGNPIATDPVIPPPPPPVVLPQISVLDTQVREGDSGVANTLVTLQLDKASTTSVTVNFATQNGTAIAGSDYQGRTGTITFNPGETRKTISIGILGDRLYEATEQFRLNLSNARGATLARPSATVTILDNDPAPPPPPPSLSVSDVQLTEGDDGTSLAQVRFTLSKASATAVSVGYRTEDGAGPNGAKAGTDYQAMSGVLTFAAGQTSQTLWIPIVGDRTIEPQENFILRLVNPNQVTLSRDFATITINDNDTAPPPTRFNYGEALQKSLLFYEAQRSGDLPDNNRTPWRKDSALGDRGTLTINGQPQTFDLSGGYYDAGDHVKFAFPLAGSLTLLSWGGVEYSHAYQTSGQWDELLATVRWGTDYLLKSHVSSGGKTLAFWAQVGDGKLDHSYWGAPETMTMERPAFAITPQKPGSELAAEAAAALASASLLFRSSDAAYANRLLDNAKQLYAFADQYRGKYSDSIPEVNPYYTSWNGYEDELAWGAAWLYKATGETTYLNQAKTSYQGVPKTITHSWDSKHSGTGVLLAQMTGEARYKTDVQTWLDYWSGHDPTNRISYTPGGLAWSQQWGSLRYAATTSFLAGIYSDRVTDTSDKRYARLAEDQIDYILGDNPRNSSYLVGFGSNFPKNPHHRAASGTRNVADPLPNKYTLYGALVGGPVRADDFAYQDVRTDYVANEVALDYNAGLTGALARLQGQFGGNPLPDAQIAVLPGLTP